MVAERRTVAVTGGTKGIGAAIATAFHGDGSFVLIGARADSGLAGRLGAAAAFAPLDARVEADHRAFVRRALDLTGRLDVYVNCVGVSSWRPVADVDEAWWRFMIDTNLTSTLWGCKAAAAYLPRSGSIINVSSLAGKRGSANNAVYCAAKFGVNGLTQALAKELGPRGIRVNAVCPVYVVTDGLLEALADDRSPAAGQPPAAYLERFAAASSALERLPLAAEVAQSCVFLASPAASAVTGQCWNVDCGVLPQ